MLLFDADGVYSVLVFGWSEVAEADVGDGLGDGVIRINF